MRSKEAEYGWSNWVRIATSNDITQINSDLVNRGITGDLRNGGASFARGLTFENLLSSRSVVFFTNWNNDTEHFPHGFGVGIKIPAAEDGRYSFITYLCMDSASDSAKCKMYHGRFRYVNSQILQSDWKLVGDEAFVNFTGDSILNFYLSNKNCHGCFVVSATPTDAPPGSGEGYIKFMRDEISHRVIVIFYSYNDSAKIWHRCINVNNWLTEWKQIN